jgi:hypothetical protein
MKEMGQNLPMDKDISNDQGDYQGLLDKLERINVIEDEKKIIQSEISTEINELLDLRDFDEGDEKKIANLPVSEIKKVNPDLAYKIIARQHNMLSRRQEMEVRRIDKELRNLSIVEIIESHPELAEKMEALSFEADGADLSLLRLQGFMDTAFLLDSEFGYLTSDGKGGYYSQSSGSSRGVEIENVSVPNMDLKVPLKLSSTCTCGSSGCQRKIFGNDPFVSEREQYRFDHQDDLKFEYRLSTEEKRQKQQQGWLKTEAGKAQNEWLMHKRESFRQALQEVCRLNNITRIVMRYPQEWLNGIEGVEIIEICKVNGPHVPGSPKGQDPVVEKILEATKEEKDFKFII